jgi:uncharacterized membrane protein
MGVSAADTIRGPRSDDPFVDPPDQQPNPARAWLAILIALIGAVTVLGLVVMWPRGQAPDLGNQPRTFVDATITGVAQGTCPGIEVPTDQPCTIYTVNLTSGPDSGDEATFSVQPTQFEVPALSDNDEVVLGFVATAPEDFRYSFEDFQRKMPLLWLVGGFAVVVLLFGRFQGLRALMGLGLSLGVLVVFVVPALLRDQPAVPVALVGTVTVAFLAIYLAHGVGMNSTIALVGTLVSLAVTCGLAIAMAEVTHLSGLASEESQVLRVTADAIDLRGLLVAGIVVGALGVLDDVTVSQVSIVAALRRANPSLGARRLYAEATRVGRDHVASAVNTLALAYAGASLPLLLFFAQGNQPAGRLVTSELVAVEIVRMLVGSIGLVLSVPVTTRLAAVVLSRTPVSQITDDDGHGHGHDQAQGHGHADVRPPDYSTGPAHAATAESVFPPDQRGAHPQTPQQPSRRPQSDDRRTAPVPRTNTGRHRQVDPTQDYDWRNAGPGPAQSDPSDPWF